MIKQLRKILILLLIFSWIFLGWPPIWQNPPAPLDKYLTGRLPPSMEQVFALNKTANWNFNGDSTGWTATNGTANGLSTGGNPSCGTTVDATSNNMATFAYNGALSSQTAFEATSGAVKNTFYHGNINQSVVAPGSGTVKVKGKFSYYGASSAWGAGKVSLDIWDSANSTFVANLGCVTMSGGTAWTTTSFSADASLTGGTTYTIRVNFIVKTKSNSNTAVTLGVDNVVVNFAPVGLSAGAVAGSTNVSLSWTASTAGSGANGLHATTPYKVYQDTSSPVSTFLANSTTNFYIDSSTAGNTTYYYAVSDVDTASDESPLSSEASVLTNPDVPTALNFTNIQATTLTVNWTAPIGGAASYKVERCAGSGCTPSQVASGVADLFYNDSELTASTLYRYRIRATNASGDGAYSGIGEQTTGAAASLTFTVSTDVFPALTPGLPVFATSTLSIDTDNSTGWNVTVSRDGAETTMDLDTDATVNITDQTAWSPGAATTTAGNAARISSLDSSGDVLAMRVMTASGTASFISTVWWGTTDSYVDSATTLWAGFNSTAKKIGDSSVSCSGANCALNTVLYYLDVPPTQKTGAYSGGITYTATMNP